MNNKSTLIKIVVIYVVVVGSWIPVTDLILSLLVNDLVLLTRMQTLKGWFTVIATAITLYPVFQRMLLMIQRSEKELEESKQWYKSIVRQQQGMTFKFKEENGRFIHTLCDGELLYQFGLVPEQVVGKELKDFLPAEMAVHKTEFYHRAWQGEENVVYENEIGGITYLASLRPLKRNERVIEVIASCVDITERKQAEEELRAMKEKLESFINHTSDGISIIDLQSNALQVNKAFENIYGWTAQEVTGRKLPVVPDAFKSMTEKLYKEVISGGQITGLETVRQRKDGSLIDVSVTISPIRDVKGNVVALAGIARDITEKKRVEEALQESEAKFRLIAENMKDLIVIADINGVGVYASPSAKGVLGFSLEEFAGTSVFRWLHPDDLAQGEKEFSQMVLEKTPRRFEFQHKHYDGQCVTIEADAIPVIGENGEVKNLVFVGRDITERKKTEELLRKSDKLSVVGQLAAGVAHEIRNPLTALRGFVQLLQSRNNGHDQYFDVMLAELDRINFIVNEFLFLAKPQAVNFQQKDLCILLLDVISLLDAQAILSNVRIQTDFGSDIPIINCEENQLKQVFINILKNSIEAMPDGGDIVIQVKRQNQENVLILFKDQGFGIPSERIPKLGEPFYTTKEKGTGLGLMVSYKIIEAHQGSIHITSQLEKGTAVEITLPV